MRRALWSSTQPMPGWYGAGHGESCRTSRCDPAEHATVHAASREEPAITELDPAALPLSEVLTLPSLLGSRLVAGGNRLDRTVRRVNIMEVPDILPWVRPHELLLTTGYPLRDAPGRLTELVSEFSAHGLSGLGIKMSRYLEEIPEEAIARADDLGLPIIALPADTGFDDIINEVLAEVLGRSADSLHRSERVMRELVDAVVTGGDLDDVCARLAHEIGIHVVVTTMDGRVRAEVPDPRAVADPPRPRELPCFDPTGRFRVESEPTGVDLAQDGMHRMSTRILGGSRDLGRLVVFSERGLGPAHLGVLEQAAAAAALVITKQQAISAVESKYRTDFVHEVMRGRITSTDRILSHAESLGWDLDRPLSVVVAEVDADADISEGDEKRTLQELFATAWTAAVKRLDEKAAVVGAGDEVIVLLPAADTERQTAAVEECIREVRGMGGGGRRAFSTGISRPAATVHDLPTAYVEATRAVEIGRRIHGGSALSHFDTLGVHRLLLQVADTEELRAFAEDTLGPLAGDAKTEYADLRETLQVLLDHNLNVAETARALFFHYNSLRYRITKLERMLGPFTTDPHLRLAITLALQIVRLP